MQADDAKTLQAMRKEIGIMQRVSYDSHIVQFFGACTTTEPAMLVMEYMRVSMESVHRSHHAAGSYLWRCSFTASYVLLWHSRSAAIATYAFVPCIMFHEVLTSE